MLYSGTVATPSGNRYWFASRWSVCYDYECRYTLADANGAGIWRMYAMFYARPSSTYAVTPDDVIGVRPVVSLKSTLKVDTTNSGDGSGLNKAIVLVN